MQTYHEVQDIANSHVCREHPGATLVVVWDTDHYRLACGEAHWADKLQRIMLPSELYRQGGPQDPNIENTLRRRDQMTTPNEQVPTKQAPERVKEAAETALQRKEEKAKEEKPSPLTLEGWYLRLRQFYPTAVVGTRPLTYDERSPAMLPADIHAWVAEVFAHPTSPIIARGHGYAWEQDEEEGALPEGPLKRVWQRAEERAEISAISRLVPLGLAPPGKE